MIRANEGKPISHDGNVYSLSANVGVPDKTVRWYERRRDITSSVQAAVQDEGVQQYLGTLDGLVRQSVPVSRVLPALQRRYELFVIPVEDYHLAFIDQETAKGANRCTNVWLYMVPLRSLGMAATELWGLTDDRIWIPSSVIPLATIEYHGVNRFQWGLRNARAIVEHVTR